jgi:hypothetical protein
MSSSFWGGHSGADLKFEMDVKYDFEAYVDVDFDTNNTYSNYVEIKDCIDWNPNIDDNTVLFNVDAQAFATDTLVDVSIVAIAVENKYSSFTATGVVVAE